MARALESLGSHTGLLVAHRLTTVMDADKILVLGNGGLIEEGSHEQLLRRTGGVYANMWEERKDEVDSIPQPA